MLEKLSAGELATTAPTQRLSVVMRCHKFSRLHFLEEALFSLAIQDWDDVEPVIVLQNGDEQFVAQVNGVVERQPWRRQPVLYQTISVPVADGVDGRSALLNKGMERATGNYLAFLDDDDVIYQHAYSTLIDQLREGGRVIAVGGSRLAIVRDAGGHWFVESKKKGFAWGRTRLDLFRENFITIHSYVIDRSRLGSFKLYFDEQLPPLEDYDFLIRLFAEHEPDMSKIDVPVCEYRVRRDGSNSIPHLSNVSPEAAAAWVRADRLIQEKKLTLNCVIKVSEIAHLVSQNSRYASEHGRIPYRAARKITAIFEQHPEIRRKCRAAALLSLKAVRRAGRLVATRNHK